MRHTRARSQLGLSPQDGAPTRSDNRARTAGRPVDPPMREPPPFARQPGHLILEFLQAVAAEQRPGPTQRAQQIGSFPPAELALVPGRFGVMLGRANSP